MQRCVRRYWCAFKVHTPFVRPASRHGLWLPSSSCYGHRHQSLLKPQPHSPALWRRGHVPSSLRPTHHWTNRQRTAASHHRSYTRQPQLNKLRVLPFYHTLVTAIKPDFLQHALDSTEANHSPPNKQSNCAVSLAHSHNSI